MKNRAEMSSHFVQSWIPIRTPRIDWPDRLPDYLECRDMLLAEIPHALTEIQSRISEVAAELKEPPAEIVQLLKQKNFLVGTKLCEYLHLTAKVSVDVEKLWEVNNTQDIEPEVVAAIASSDMSEAIERLLLLSELAYPSCINTMDGLVAVDGQASYPIRAKGTFHFLHFPEEDVPAWPPIKFLSLTTVIGWAQQTNLIGSGLAQSRIERALAAYTHVVGLTWQRDGEVLFRAMQGLEAFYCDGIGDLRRQLSEKVSIWLGPWTERKNVVGQLYDLRSKFIHGSARIEYWNHHADPWTEDERAMMEFSSGVSLSVRLLVASLQKCIIDRVFDVVWTYAVEPRRQTINPPGICEKPCSPEN